MSEIVTRTGACILGTFTWEQQPIHEQRTCMIMFSMHCVTAPTLSCLGARTVLPLDSKIPRQEITIDSDGSATEMSMGSSQASSASFSIPTDDERVEGYHSDHTTVSAGSCHNDSKPWSVHQHETAHVASANDHRQSTQGLRNTAETDGPGIRGLTSSDDQAGRGVNDLDVPIGGTEIVDVDDDMVYVYPQYLLQGSGLQLLKLCMAMWSADPGDRPTCEAILEELATL